MIESFWGRMQTELLSRKRWKTRLGLQGIELLSTGRITLPVPEPHRGYLRFIRRGERALDEVLEAITDADERLGRLRDSPRHSRSAGPALGR